MTMFKLRNSDNIKTFQLQVGSKKKKKKKRKKKRRIKEKIKKRIYTFVQALHPRQDVIQGQF